MIPFDDDPNGMDRSGTNNGVDGLLDALRTIFGSLSKIEAEGGHRKGEGHIDQNWRSVDYRYDVSIGLSEFSDDFTEDDHRGKEPPKTIRFEPESADKSYVIRVDETGDKIRVFADLPGTAERDIDVSVTDDGNLLELTVEDEVVESVPLNWDETTLVDVSFTNKILEVTMEKNHDS
ncbi:gas vesicle protein GvpH [Halodesulfurarchaeum sp.]|uniref:gas vesicle protein GvpH n=1 Tax=Halodesulfurarchaeum sp. TaxID=1980530 RepID=UPI002FC33DF9